MGPGFESQPVHKACHVSDRLFCCADAKQACLFERISKKKGNETRSGSLKALSKDPIQGCRSSEARTTIPNL